MSETRLYYKSGALYKIERPGEQMAYYEDGTLKTVAHFVDGECRLYWPNGKLKRHLFFKAGVRYGIEKFWDEEGNLSLEIDHA